MLDRKDIRGICVKDHKFIVGVATLFKYYFHLFILSMVDE
jgi:hypothetical protein